MNLFKLLLRIVIGGVFVGHGLQKLRGYFDGPGLDGTEKMITSLGLEPAKVHARAVAATETFGGAALVLGAATPAASAGLIATMLTAIRTVHWKNGPWNSKGGFEFNAVLIASLLALTADGPGLASFDALIGRSKWGARGGLFALLGGIAGSVGVIAIGRRTAANQLSETQSSGTPAARDEPSAL